MMPPAFPIGAVIGPVAVATVQNVFLFAAFWRWNQAEIKTGTLPWPFWIALLAYLLPLGVFAYSMLDKPITTPLQVFVGAVEGEFLGGLVVYGLLNAFLWTKGQPTRERIAPMIGSLFLLAVMAAAVFS